jgi:hypothetical protein
VEDEEVRAYTIEILVTDPDVDTEVIRWLLDNVVEVHSIKEHDAR